jgi:S-methylmethionine-dependent homocysteine/selenocysteine methylase
MYNEIARKLAAGGVVILDGGTGTEIQRQGVVMDSEVWCAMANLTHADAVRSVHTDYINAGAEVITANTYASSPLSFAHLGREDEIESIDRAAVSLARDAVEEAASSPVAVAGSCSVMPPVARGTDRVPDRQWDPARIKPLYERKTEVLADAGCDLIIMEMMRDLEVSLWATEAAVATGLPVWVGISVERNDEGELVSFANHQWGLAELTERLMATGAHAALVMHNEISTTDESLDLIRSVWNGPVGAYPEAGHFEMPTWVFRELSPREFAEAAVRWRGAGASILGGCCGITPEHIRALRDAVINV